MSRLLALVSSLVLLLGLLPMTAAAAEPIRPDRPLPDTIKAAKLDQPVTGAALKDKVHTSLTAARGPQRVVVRLSVAPSVDMAADGAAAQTTQLGRVKAQHRQFIANAKRIDAKVRVLGETQRATNLVSLRIDASKIAKLALDPNVVSISPVVDYEKALDETVPYIGARAVQKAGTTGKGVRVGVIDSGIDYTHAEFGGPGTQAAYDAAYGTSNDDSRNVTLDGLFPTAKVAGGFDFVGESWPGGDGIEDPDPDPIDFEGHGTHVADIIGGIKGVAPGVKLYALKVCSAVATSCSGVGLLGAMDWAIDPNGDGITRDHLDIVNMSLGSDYGESFDDDLSLAVDNASKLGMLTVAAAGQRRRQAVDRGHTGQCAHGPVGRPDPGPECRGLPARGQQPGGDQRRVQEHGDRRLGAHRRWVHRRRRLCGPGLPGRFHRRHEPGRSVPGRPGRQGRAHRSWRLLDQPQGRAGRQGRRDRQSCSASSPPAIRSVSPMAAAIRSSRPWSSSSR